MSIAGFQCTCIVFALFAGARAEAGDWTVTSMKVDAETMVIDWTGNRGTEAAVAARGHGTQIYTPVSARIDGRFRDLLKYALSVKGGATRSEQLTDETRGLYEGLLDTQGQLKLTYLGAGGLQPFLSLAVNAPTGTSALGRGERFARMDGDLVEVTSFGQGWNVNPAVGITAAINDAFYVSSSVGATWRGAYRRDRGLEAGSGPAGPQVIRDFDPADSLNASLTFLYETGPWSLTATLTEAWEGEATEDDMALYRKGLRSGVTLSADYKWSDRWTTSASAMWSYADRNMIRQTALPYVPLVDEIGNSNAHLWILGLDQVWTEGAWTVTGSLGYQLRAANGYDIGEDLFVPRKDKVSAGLALGYAMSPDLTLKASLSGSWTFEDRAEPGLVAVDQQALIGTVGVSWKPKP